MDYIFSVRSVRRGAFTDEPGATHFLAVPPGTSSPRPEHALRKTAWFDVVFKAARHGLQDDAPRGDVLFYVHGYNTPQETMLARQRLIRDGLEAKGFEGVVVGFDWPAASLALNYLEDRLDAKFTAFRLVTEGIASFARMQRADCFVNLHILAHSTGALRRRERLDDADHGRRRAQQLVGSAGMLISANIAAVGGEATAAKSSSFLSRIGDTADELPKSLRTTCCR